jgi:hypothetical protein
VNGVAPPSLGDRISFPFGLAARPLAGFAIMPGWWRLLLASFDVQLGVTVEHLRTSDDSATVAGLHAALALELPIYGSPQNGGVSVRLGGRVMVTPQVTLDGGKVVEPIGNGQLYGGIAFYP